MNRYEGKTLPQINSIIKSMSGQPLPDKELLAEAKARRNTLLAAGVDASIEELPVKKQESTECLIDCLDYKVAKKFISKAENAKKRGIKFDLTLQDVKRILKTKKCYYTHVELVDSFGHPHHLTFDRIDSSKGYTKENTVACSDKANQLKNYLFEKAGSPISCTIQEMSNFAITMAKISESK